MVKEKKNNDNSQYGDNEVHGMVYLTFLCMVARLPDSPFKIGESQLIL